MLYSLTIGIHPKESLRRFMTWEEVSKSKPLSFIVDTLLSHGLKWCFSEQISQSFYALLFSMSEEDAAFVERCDTKEVLDPTDVVYVDALLHHYLVLKTEFAWRDLEEMGLEADLEISV